MLSRSRDAMAIQGLNVGAAKMTVETSAKTCPRCNSLISSDAPGGLCPRCLMQFVALSTGGSDFPSDDRLPPDLETVRAAFPHLEILELIGQGGMGAVYKARQTKLDRIVALKILPLRLAREPLFAERFEREGRMLARLNHPNIVAVHDFGKADGLYYLMMEYVDGVNLRQAFASSQFTPQQALKVIPKICEALQFAHDEGVLHRDIKPENILLDTKGRVKIADFGIAKFSGVDDKTGLTATGATIGTPHYMAPEQIESPSDVDHRADIFSLGVVFYEMLTGELPLGRFAAPSERTEALDVRIDQVVMRALEKDRDRRQQSANEVRTEVEFLSNHSASKNAATQTAAKPPVLAPMLSTSETGNRFQVRSKLAISLVIASIVIPLLVGLYLDATKYPTMLSVYISMIAAWFGIPGTILGVIHLQYLGRSGHRNGLLATVIASTFWPFTIALGFFLFLAMELLQSFHNGNSNSVEPIEVTLVLVFGLVAPLWGVRSIHKWVNRIPPKNGIASQDLPSDPALRIVSQVIAGTLWIFFGLAIISLAPVGTLERIMLALMMIGVAVMGARAIKRWIDGTPPASALVDKSTHPVDIAIQNILKGFAALVWIGLMLAAIYIVPRSRPMKQLSPSSYSPPASASAEWSDLHLELVKIGTKENVLFFEVIQRHPPIPIGMNGVEDMAGSMTSNFDQRFQINFQGPKLLPEAIVLASESYEGTYYLPGELSDIETLGLSDGKPRTLAFAFPDAVSAKACMLRMQRYSLSGQWPAPFDGQNTKVLFEAYSLEGQYWGLLEPSQ